MHTRDMNTATITITTGSVVKRSIVSKVDVTFDGPFDRTAARSIARANVETVKGQAVEVRSETGMFRFSHAEIAR